MKVLPTLILSVLLTLTTTHGHNITRILAKHPEFSTFNHYLTVTHLAAEINRRQTITVCAVDNAGMSALLARGLPISTLKNVLSLHVFADYFGAKKLHQITKGSTLTATMFQATGEAPGTSGYVNITDLKGGKVGFGAEDNGGHLNAVFVKSVQEMPYNISVIHISQVIASPEAEAPTAGPKVQNLTSLMVRQGCKAFYDLLVSSGSEEIFTSSVESGLSVFCPSDSVVNAFMPKYNNLTKSAKTALVLYHGVPVYQSMGMLRSNNGVMNTLATEGANKYDFTVQNDGEDVKLETKVVTATITGTIVDEDPLSVYKIDKVLQPRELFKAAPVVKGKKAPAPKGDSSEDEAEAPGPDGSEDEDADSADQTASDNNGSHSQKIIGGGLIMALAFGFVGGMGFF